MEENKKIETELVHLARLALSGRGQDIQALIRRIAKKYRSSNQNISEELLQLLRESPTRSTPLRKKSPAPLPVDTDSRLNLVRVEHIGDLGVGPIFTEVIRIGLDQIIREREKSHELEAAGLHLSSTALFFGPPGVGKTLAAKWLASKLKLPLVTLDLSAVMSSFLGRTGNNLRYVLDYAKSNDCVLLLDELDAIAKRRDDSTEVGELKRLVTVLLQEIDDWPNGSLLLAATNHPNLLDPAVWRRFDIRIEFKLPDYQAVQVAVSEFIGKQAPVDEHWIKALGHAFTGSSFSDIRTEINRMRRLSLLNEETPDQVYKRFVFEKMRDLPRQDRLEIAVDMIKQEEVSQRKANELTGLSRDTIRKALNNANGRS